MTEAQPTDEAASIPDPTDPPQVAESEIDELASEQSFMLVARSVGGILAETTDERILALGHSICDDLVSGQSLIDVGMPIMNAGYTAGEAGTVSGAAISMFCPQYGYLLD